MFLLLKLYQHRLQIAKNNFCAIKGTTSTPPKLVVTPPAHNSTLQRHPAMAPRNHSTLQWHPAMAPRPLRQSWPSPSPPPTIAHYSGTQQWHHVHSTIAHYNGTSAIASSNGTTSTPPKLAVTLPSPNHSTLQWHPTMEPSNGTTLQWHPGATSNGRKWFVTLPPIGSKNPYSYRYLGKKRHQGAAWQGPNMTWLLEWNPYGP